MAFIIVFLFLLWAHNNCLNGIFLCQKHTSHTNTQARQRRGKYAPSNNKKASTSKQMIFASLDTSCSSTSHLLLFLLSPPTPPPASLSEPPKCFSHAFFPSVLFAGRRREEEVAAVVLMEGVEGKREVGFGVRTDEVSMATPHCHGPDWTMRWLIIHAYA